MGAFEDWVNSVSTGAPLPSASAIPDYVPAQSQLPSQPVDTAGGSPGNYGAQVMDLFKFGIGAWQANNAQSNAIDYKKWETTAGIATQQGQISANAVNRTPVAGQSSSGAIMVIGLILVVLVLKKAA